MGIWPGIKKALNSTIGTQEFQPLDKIIQGQRTLAASDSVIQILEFDRNNASSNSYNFGSFKVKVNGSVRIIVNYSGGSSNSSIRLGVNQNGTEIFYKTVNGAANNQLLTADIKVDKTSEYTVTLRRSSSTYTIHNVSVGANIVDTSLVEVL